MQRMRRCPWRDQRQYLSAPGSNSGCASLCQYRSHLSITYRSPNCGCANHLSLRRDGVECVGPQFSGRSGAGFYRTNDNYCASRRESGSSPEFRFELAEPVGSRGSLAAGVSSGPLVDFTQTSGGRLFRKRVRRRGRPVTPKGLLRFLWRAFPVRRVLP